MFTLLQKAWQAKGLRRPITPHRVGEGRRSTLAFARALLVINEAKLFHEEIGDGANSRDVERALRTNDGVFDGVLDVFNDGTFWAIHVSGHTAGSTAYVARTPSGPVLMTGDACRTAWGWEHGVEPGSFSTDKKKSAESLDRLRRFAAKHPHMDIRLGHQPR